MDEDYTYSFKCGCKTMEDGTVTNRCAKSQQLYDAAMADKDNLIKTDDYAVHFEVNR